MATPPDEELDDAEVTPPFNELSLQDEEDTNELTEDVIMDIEQAAKKTNKTGAGNRFSIKARRVIEDHIEQRRLRKELDYLYDDEFFAGEGDKEQK